MLIMKNKAGIIILTLFFIGLLAVPIIIKRLNASNNVDSSSSRYGFQFTESSKESGIDFRHQAAAFDPKLNHIMEQISVVGASVTVADYDRDGWTDFFVTSSSENGVNALYRNQGNGSFKNVADEVGLSKLNSVQTGVSVGSVWGDYDNDGYEDLFIYKWGKPELFHNDNGKKFTRVTDNSGLPAWVNAGTALWLDYDRDGKLDLFIGGYYSETINLWNLKDTKIMPESFEYANNGGRKFLLRNLGGGRFEDVADKVGLKSNRWAFAAVAADLRGTGYPDLFIANDYGVSELFFNDQGKGFRDAGKQTGVGYSPKSGMNASIGDVLNHGSHSIYVSNISEAGILLQGNNLWVPKDGTSGDNIQYENMATAFGVDLGMWSFGSQFGDFNNDGFVDIYLVNGYISADQKQSYWYDYSKIVGGNKAIISDAANWPPMEGRSHAGYQQKRVWINDGAGKFTDVAQAVGVKDVYDGRSIAVADFGNKGKLDVITANQRGPVLLYKNTVELNNKWIAFDLEGTKSNRSAIGAQVRVFWNNKVQLQEITGGSGFCAQNQRRLHFGLGKTSKIDKVEIRWPSGKVDKLASLDINTIHQIKEGN